MLWVRTSMCVHKGVASTVIAGGVTRLALDEVNIVLHRKREGLCLPDNGGLLSGVGPGKGGELAALVPEAGLCAVRSLRCWVRFLGGMAKASCRLFP